MNSKIITKVTSGILICTILTYTTPVFAYTKDETVYSKLDSSGSNYSTIVNEHIKNEEANKIINDISDLLNIENVNGDENPQQDENNLIWNANGSDIYYQGESQKSLPIECNVKYELDGEEISAKEIAGKKGKVKITIEYINKDKHVVSINGKNETLYTPFVVVCGTIIDNDNNKNIEITNGKVIDDGSKTTLIGMSLPGLQESLNISKDKLDISNIVEITMESTDFELNNIVTYVTPKVVEDSDLELFDNIDEIYNKVNTLQNSSNQLEQGANTLQEGTNTYKEKSQEFNNAMKQIANGTSTVNSNYSKIDDGISSLSSGSKDLENGVNELNSGINKLNSELTSLPESVESLYSGSTQILNSLDTDTSNGRVGLVDGVNSIISSLNKTKENLEEVLSKSSKESKKAIEKLNENNASLQAAIDALKIQDPNSPVIKSLEEQIKDNNKEILEYSNSKEENDKTKAYVEKQAQENIASLNKVKNGMTQLKEGMSEVNGGLGQLNMAAKQLPSNLSKLSEGTKSLANGTKALSSGATNLNMGSTQLKSGIQTLDTSTKQLSNANDQLNEGANTLSQGMTTLATGISKFNNEGINTICNYINGDIKDISNRLEKLKELSEEYNNFTMLNDGNKGNVKFIMIMDSIKKEENDNQDIIIDDNNKVNEDGEEE